MKIKDILHVLPTAKIEGDHNIVITGLQMDSRKVEEGNAFICVRGIDGFLQDRHDFAKDAVRNGASAVVVEQDVEVDVPKIFVKDARHAMAVLSSYFYQHPSQELNLIGITGTNGKTTTAFITEKIFSDYGLKTGLMGNNGIKIDGNMHPTDINTQEPPVLQRNLRTMRDHHTDYCIMEVTSQGLDMGRVVGCDFKTAIFTNLTQDHLDYHGSFEEYRNTKGLLFSRLGNTFHPEKRKHAVLNRDDEAFAYFEDITAVDVITYGIKNEEADVHARNIQLTAKGISFHLTTYKGETEITLPLIGMFNVYNALAAISAALIENIPLECIQKSLATMPNVGGRMEIIDEKQPFLVVVDYAHTPDALENVLSSLKEFATGNIITVFGCGGNRDVTKRPLMGEIAERYSDYVIVTSDNPRSEDPIDILKDIEKSFSTEQYELVVQREFAIKKAIEAAEPGDIVLIAGKGHETYQIFHDQTIHFDDREVARKVLQP
ncbi:UDP-N-acetylmuramoyl-L-alanyl-D-glutamate--2,6-diaminopimelate ligase [Priestia koreensis]|uniref:UDP-N-acetylmuramoyl-L-alanyl-D-glutamate--2, 6-diaminopimelate ligase n=1 Tax=Priestia koreensis TaxID=284581 RepID=UPI0028F70C43|nr:UDP-N-acetylmuramoyl-L-alanyl-D-glutamate--2,6-diaminopimelate ligase [Priestia koreensis]